MKKPSREKPETKGRTKVSDGATKRKGTATTHPRQKALTSNLPKDPAPRTQVEKIVLSKAIELRLKGLSYNDIANHFSCTKSAVIQRLAPYLDKGEVDVEVYKKNRADLMSLKGASVLAAITPAKVKKASAKDLAIVYGTLYDKERLERGQSTSNQSVFFHIVQEACEAE